MPSWTAEELTDPYVQSLRRVPAAGPGVCAICHSGPGSPDFTRCYSCHQTTSTVSRALSSVVPISLVTKSGTDQLYHLLRSYKGPNSTEMQVVRVAGLIARHLEDHGGCVAGPDGWDVVTTVPSTRQRTTRHPLEVAVGAIEGLPYEPLLDPHRPPFDRAARDDMFSVTRDVSDERILLVDDVFTTGSRIQSCASALALAGATVVGAVVVGRIIQPDYNECCRNIWAWSTAAPFDFAVCAICGS